MIEKIKLLQLTLPETKYLKSGNTDIDRFECRFNIKDILPDIVIQATLKRVKDKEDWFWCAPRLFYHESLNIIVGSGIYIRPLNERKVELGYGVVKPYEGKLYRSGSIEMSRGCPQKCTYCINESLRTAYLETDSKLIRKKTVANTIKEAKFLKEKHDLEMFFFCDDNFLAITRDRMAEFKDKWKKEINLPFWLNTTLESVTDWRLAALKECGCAGIGIGVESGNEWVRNEILKRNSHNGNSKLIEVFKMIEEHGIRTTANAMIGFPGETEADMFETVKLVKAIKPMSYDITFVAPYIGTPLHLLAKEKKLIKIESNNPGFNGMASEIGLRKGSIIENPYVTKEKMEHIVNNFVDYVKGELPIPEEFLVEAPGSSPTALDRSDSLEEAQFINLVFDDINKQKQAYRDKKMVN